MSQENVEIIGRSLDAWNRHDLEALLALTHPEFEYVNAPSAVEPGTRRGHEGLASVARAQWEYMPGTVIELDRVHDRGDEVITEGHLSRLMPGSDSRVNTSVLSSWKFRDGMLVRLETLGAGPEFADALEAAGLSE
jgi:ketosteroid isomerase-like protein